MFCAFSRTTGALCELKYLDAVDRNQWLKIQKYPLVIDAQRMPRKNNQLGF